MAMMTPYQRALAARKRARALGTKRRYKPVSYARRAKKGRTGGKRRADTMHKISAPVSRGTKVSKGARGPAGVGYNMQQVSDTCTRITGRAYIGEVSTKGKVPTNGGNAIGLVFDINPALLNDRVAVIASTFEKYVYHGVKFTYVPQCATSVSGSVGLVFDRDPLQYAACVNTGQFLAEVMSYEHAVLTPGYVGASTAYTRDPKELKTWFIGSPDATLSTRETSQGNFLAYVSNGIPDTGYGFIVMDYVLDLVAPNLLPAKQNVTDIKSAPSQWQDFNTDMPAAGTMNFYSSGFINMPVGPAASIAYPLFVPDAAWLAQLGPTYATAGCVGEYILGGRTGTGYTSFPSTLKDAGNNTITFKHGQKLYFCVHIVNQGTGVGSDLITVSFHTTLSSARAAQGTFNNSAVATSAVTLADCIYAPAFSTLYAFSGWLRLITDGTAAVTNNA